jgi:hypothetical protein
MRLESRSLASAVAPWNAIDHGAFSALAMTLGAAGAAGVAGTDGVTGMFGAPPAAFEPSAPPPLPHAASASAVMHVAAHAAAAISTRFGMPLLLVAIQAEL